MTPRTIPESTIGALRELLVCMVREETAAGANGVARAGDAVRRALRELCDEARESRVKVEQLLIAIKQGWTSLHSENPRTRAAGPDGLLNHVITLCIDEYYADLEARREGR